MILPPANSCCHPPGPLGGVCHPEEGGRGISAHLRDVHVHLPRDLGTEQPAEQRGTSNKQVTQRGEGQSLYWEQQMGLVLLHS